MGPLWQQSYNYNKMKCIWWHLVYWSQSLRLWASLRCWVNCGYFVHQNSWLFHSYTKVAYIYSLSSWVVPSFKPWKVIFFPSSLSISTWDTLALGEMLGYCLWAKEQNTIICRQYTRSRQKIPEFASTLPFSWICIPKSSIHSQLIHPSIFVF